MKPTLLFTFLLGLMLFGAAQAGAQNRNKTKAKTKTNQAASVTVPKKSVRGAASAQELGQYVFSALQENNFEAIAQYFPTETDLTNTENRTADEDLKLVLENQNPTAVQAAFRKDFEELQSKAVEQGLSFQQLSLMEVQAGAPLKANRLMPVNLLLSNPNNETLAITFETLKINGRFFLFQHIGVKPQE